MRVRTHSVRFLSVAGAVAALAAVSTAASPPGLQASGNQIVVRALDGQGQPVLDLKPADLSIRIDGRDREIKSLELVQPGETAPAAPSTFPAVPASNLPPPYATNVINAPAKGAREFVIAIDDEGIAPGREQPVRAAVKALVGSLGPVDAVGLVGLKSGGFRLAPTTDHATVLTSLERIVAMGSTAESANDMGCRTKTVLAGIASVLQDASPARNVVIFSAGVAPPSGEAIRTRLGQQTDAEAAMCQVHQRDLDALGRTASASPAAIYVVFVTEAVANVANRSTGEAGLENIAGVTNGAMIRLLGTDAVVDRIARTAGTYYLATIDQAAVGQRIDARVSRSGVRAVARPVAPAPAAKAEDPRDMIRNTAVFRDLPLRAAGFVSRQQGKKELQVMALFEPHEPEVKLSAAVVGLIDQNGSLKAQWTAQPPELTRSPVVAALPIEPGTYRLRVAATDTKGRGGTTDYELDASLIEAGAVKLGDMVLGVGQNGFVPKLHFTSEDAAAIGFLYIYDVPKDAKLDVTFELAREEQGEAIGSGQGTVAAGPDEGTRIAYGGFGVAAIEPGDYILRAVVNVDGKRVGVASHTLRRLK